MKNLIQFSIVFFVTSFVFVFGSFAFNAAFDFVKRPQGGFSFNEYVQIAFNFTPVFATMGIMFMFTFENFNKFFCRRFSFFRRFFVFAFILLCGMSSTFAQAPGDSREYFFSKEPNAFISGTDKVEAYAVNRVYGWDEFTFVDGKILVVCIFFDKDTYEGAFAAGDFAKRIEAIGTLTNSGYKLLYQQVPCIVAWTDTKKGRLFLFKKDN
jgi:hypothetical protein